MPGRCAVCLCPADFHDHYTSPQDTRCGTCGPAACPAYVDPGKPLPKLTPDQRRTRQIAQERTMFNALCLLPFVQSSKPAPPVPIPRQRTVRDYLDKRRAQARKGGPHA